MISVMKPPLSPSMSDGDVKDMKMKKKVKAVENDNNMEGQAHFDNNFMFEVLKHVDAWTLVMSGCLNK